MQSRFRLAFVWSLLISIQAGAVEGQQASPSSLTFVNQTQGTVAFYWVDFNNQEQLYGHLPAGQSYTQETYVGDRWIVRDATNQALKRVTAQQARQQVVVGSAVVAAKPSVSRLRLYNHYGAPIRVSIQRPGDRDFTHRRVETGGGIGSELTTGTIVVVTDAAGGQEIARVTLTDAEQQIDVRPPGQVAPGQVGPMPLPVGVTPQAPQPVGPRPAPPNVPTPTRPMGGPGPDLGGAPDPSAPSPQPGSGTPQPPPFTPQPQQPTQTPSHVGPNAGGPGAANPSSPNVGPHTGSTPTALAPTLHPKVRRIAESLRSVAREGGSVRLSQLAGVLPGVEQLESVLSHLGINVEISISGIQFGSDGSMSGSMTFLGQTTSVILQLLPPDSLGIPQWALSVKAPDLSKALLPPEVMRELEAQLFVRPPVFVISSLGEEIELASHEMSHVTRSFYASLHEEANFVVTMKPGIRYTAGASFKSSIHQDLKRFGFEFDNSFNIEGQLLAKLPIDPATVQEILRSKATSLMEGNSLRATLPRFKAPIPAQVGDLGTVSGGAYMEVTAKPSVEIGWITEIDPRDPRQDTKVFTSKMRVAAELLEGTGTVTFVAKAEGLWNNAFGIDRFNMDELTLVVSVDTGLNLTVGGQSRSSLGLPGFEREKVFDMAGKVAVTFKSGVPALSDVAVRYGSDEDPVHVNTEELVAVINLLAQSGRPNAAPVQSGNVPDLQLDNFFFSVAPQGGDDDLKIEDGVAFSGDLDVEGYMFEVAAKLNWTDDPTVLMKGSIPDFDVRGLTVRDVGLDLLLSSSRVGDSHLMVSGMAELLGNHKLVKISMEKERFFFNFKDKVNGVFETDFLSETRTREGSWRFNGLVTSELASIGQQASREVRQWAQNRNANFNQAQAQLSSAERVLAMKRGELTDAEDAARAEIKRVSDRLADLESTKRKKQQAWDALGRFVPSALRKDTKAALDRATNALSRFRETAGWALDAVGPEVAPNVIRIKSEIVAAETAVNTARNAVELARQGTTQSLTIAAQGLNAPIFVVDEMRLTGNLNAWSRSSDSVNVQMRYRYLGQVRTLNETMNISKLDVSAVAAKLKAAVGI